ncbi:hypothetical protein [Flagellimonas taeanensis]|nr:hypothetical protein [Allomuricauda taeanensis]
MKTTFKIMMVLILVFATKGQAQKEISVPLDPKTLEIDANEHRFEAYKGKTALYLKNGRAWLKDASFKNGTIEYDITFGNERNFAGVHFHIQDANNYEEYYLRPHQSGNPDAMQYSPVINGNAAWQLYHGEGYWSPFQFTFGEWMHVKLVIRENKMQVYINDMENPILHVTDLKLGEKSGGLGFGSFLGGTHYANLTYQNTDDVALVKSEENDHNKENRSGIISSYEVSEAFPSKKLGGITVLKDLNIPVERKMKAEASGILNLSKVSPVSEDTNTVLAKFNISSNSGDETKRLEFGYSDKVKVFVNGKLVYGGDNSFRSRDYRYLGSMGFFDSIHLNLRKGNNEITFAVTERMGGWGVMARLSD